MSIRNFNYASPAVQDLLASPGAVSRVLFGINSGSLPPPLLRELLTDLRQFRRAEEGERMRPDLYPGPNDSVNPQTVANRHGYPTPFSKPETHRPDRLPGTPQHDALKRIDDRMRTEILTNDLQHRIGTDADRPPDPPTLRDQIEAAASIHSEEN